VGTERIRSVFVCPRPPFQPCTAMTGEPGLLSAEDDDLKV